MKTRMFEKNTIRSAELFLWTTSLKREDLLCWVRIINTVTIIVTIWQWLWVELRWPAVLQCLTVTEASPLPSISFTGAPRSVNITAVLFAPFPPDLPPGGAVHVVRLVAGTDCTVGVPVTAASVPSLIQDKSSEAERPPAQYLRRNITFPVFAAVLLAGSTVIIV